jgi:hypothetical protein
LINEARDRGFLWFSFYIEYLTGKNLFFNKVFLCAPFTIID